jgi:hypothetical protein
MTRAEQQSNKRERNEQSDSLHSLKLLDGNQELCSDLYPESAYGDAYPSTPSFAL